MNAGGEQTTKVHLPGHGTFWFLANADGEGPLARLEHCDERGKLHWSLAPRTSYAHVYTDGVIRRFGQVIGQVGDLETIASEVC